MSEELVSQAE